MTEEKTRFADAAFAYEEAKYEFMDELSKVDFEEGDHFKSIGYDDYDCSVEFYKVGNDVRLTLEQQKVIYDAGFIKIYLNHEDGWETHYHWTAEEITKMKDGPFIPKRGWRRRYVGDPNAKTTNVIVGPPNPGYYEISYWPESWNKNKADLETGYMRIVPDPLDPDNSL